MLELIRKYRSLFMIIFAVAAVGMIVSMGMPSKARGMGGGGGSLFSSSAVAKVGSQTVTRQELEQDLFEKEERLRKMFGAQMNSEQGKKFYDQIRKTQLSPDRIVDELVQKKLFHHLFDEQHMQISAGALRGQIEQLPYFKKNGTFDPALYRKMVASPKNFENSLRDQMKGEKVLEPFAFVASMVTDGEIESGRVLAKKRDFELLTVSPKVIKKDVAVTEAEVEQIAADEKKTADLQNYYNRNIREYKKPEEISAKHILIRDEDGGEAKTKEVLAEIKSGKISFEEAAKKYSKDASNAPKGGDLGYFARGVMDKSFEAAAFALKNAGDISEPVKSSFGYHLIKLDARRAAVEKKFGDVKREIAREYAKDQKKLEQAKTLVDGWLKSKRGPEAAQLKAYGLTWSKVPGWDPSQSRLGTLGEGEVKTDEIMKLSKDEPLLKHSIASSGNLILVRWAGEKSDPVTVEDLSYQKALRLTDLYFQRYKKNLEEKQQITKNAKVLDEVKKSFQL